MGNTTCKPRGGESLKDYLIRKFSSFSGKKKIDELLQLAVDEEHRFPGQHNVRLTRSQLKIYYEQRDALVDEYADDVIEAELLGLGTNSTTSVTDADNTCAKKRTKKKKKYKKKPDVRNSLAMQKVKSAAVVHAPNRKQTDVSQSTAVVKANTLSNAVAPLIGHPCGENTDVYKSSPVIKAVASISNVKKSAGDGRKPQLVKVQPCVEPDGKCFAPRIQTPAPVSFTPGKRCGMPTIQSCDRLLPDIPPASSSPALPMSAKEIDQPTSTPAPIREEKSLAQSLQPIIDRLLPSQENDRFDQSNAIKHTRGKTPSNDLVHRIQPGCRTRTNEPTRTTDKREKEKKPDVKLELQARAKMLGLDKGIVWPATLEELTSFNKVYYVGQFLNTQLFKQRVVRKEKGLGSWKNGLTPFQTWVIQHDGTLELEAVLQPPRRRPNHAQAKTSCWRGNTPLPPPRPDDCR